MPFGGFCSSGKTPKMVEAMAADADDLQKPQVAEFKDFALKRMHIIEKFGQFHIVT
jgi:hypothetical protein